MNPTFERIHWGKRQWNNLDTILCIFYFRFFPCVFWGCTMPRFNISPTSLHKKEKRLRGAYISLVLALKPLANPRKWQGCLMVATYLFIGILHMPRVPLHLDMYHLATRGKMIHMALKASDGHRPFMKLFCLDTNYTMTPYVSPRFSSPKF